MTLALLNFFTAERNCFSGVIQAYLVLILKFAQLAPLSVLFHDNEGVHMNQFENVCEDCPLRTKVDVVRGRNLIAGARTVRRHSCLMEEIATMSR